VDEFAFEGVQIAVALTKVRANGGAEKDFASWRHASQAWSRLAALPRAIATAWVRFPASNFRNMDPTCDLTVPTVTVSFNAMALFVRPDVMRAKISSSPLVSASRIVRSAMRHIHFACFHKSRRGGPNLRLGLFDLQTKI